MCTSKNNHSTVISFSHSCINWLQPNAVPGGSLCTDLVPMDVLFRLFSLGSNGEALDWNLCWQSALRDSEKKMHSAVITMVWEENEH
jgi:hypothetical protein